MFHSREEDYSILLHVSSTYQTLTLRYTLVYCLDIVRDSLLFKCVGIVGKYSKEKAYSLKVLFHIPFESSYSPLYKGELF